MQSSSKVVHGEADHVIGYDRYLGILDFKKNKSTAKIFIQKKFAKLNFKKFANIYF